nr:unnamed protein product [Spirometra erinaceieuropaei]
MPSRQPPVPWQPPQRPLSREHIDFAGPLNGVSYLILVDTYSKWPESAPLNPATTSATTTPFYDASLTSMASQKFWFQIMALSLPRRRLRISAASTTSSIFARRPTILSLAVRRGVLSTRLREAS